MGVHLIPTEAGMNLYVTLVCHCHRQNESSWASFMKMKDRDFKS